MAAKIGSTYIFGTMIDSVQISTMTSSRKCSQMIATTTNWYSITVLFSVTYCRCMPVDLRNHGKCQNDIFACHSNKCADENEKREYYCHSMSVYGGIFYHQIFTVSPPEL